MPRNVRNAWIEVAADGRKANVATGPQSSSGRLLCTLTVREHGSISPTVFDLEVHPLSDGRLQVTFDTRNTDTQTASRLFEQFFVR